MNRVVFFLMPKTGSRYISSLINHSNEKCENEGEKIVKLNHGYIFLYKYRAVRLKNKNFNMFCFVRNPFSRLVSAYNYIIRGGQNHIVDLMAQKYIMKYKDFNNFCLNLKNIVKASFGYHFVPQYQWIYDNDEVLINNIGKYENLFEDYKKFSDKFNFSFIWTDEKEHSIFLSQRKDYIDHYNEKSVKAVIRVYKKDFDLFGYSKKLI